MWTDRRGLLTLGVLFFVLAAAFFVGSWPAYRNAARVNETIETVHLRVQNHEQEMESLEALATRLNKVRDVIEHDLRTIPSETAMATLMTALAVPVDKITVYDQTFNSGKIRAINAVSDDMIMCVPITIGMDATFAVVFDILQRVEEMNDLVRVSSLNIDRHPEIEGLVRAVIQIDAVFQPDVKASGLPIEKKGGAH